MYRYAAPIFLGAFLLFQVQPLIARYILPWFGGTPSVWTTCMLFFQVLLLLGYAYAHLVIVRLRPRTQAVVHTALLAVSLGVLVLMTLTWGTPIIPSLSWKPQDSNMPVWRVIEILGVAVGLPYLVLATTSPLLQAWFSRTDPGVSPYRLYTLSNAGSLLALVSYPFVVEPALALKAQARLWSGAFVLFSLAYAACAIRVWRLNPQSEAATPDPGDTTSAHPARLTQALWVGLPALASVLLLAVTNQMCQEIAVIPFLWILPLSLYLLSFIICFDNERWYSRYVYVPLTLVSVALVAAIMPRTEDISLKLQIPAYSLALFACCMVCHGELVAIKPSPRYLTGFYLAIAAGGAIGGIFVGAIAPVIFKWYWELPIGLVLAWLLGIAVIYRDPRIKPTWVKHLVPAGLAVSLCVFVVPKLIEGKRDNQFLLMARNFYGVLCIRDDAPDDDNWHKHTLVHGQTIHGFQFLSPKKRYLSSSYYGTNSGVGLSLLSHPRRFAARPEDRALRVGIVGLGTGSLCVYGRKGDYLRFYDINPKVLYVARDSGYFTYLNDCKAKVDVVMGDARISLERELKDGSQQFDVLVLDAFSSDAIPAHLLTSEAFELYEAHLRQPQGILAVHVSNRALDLKPVVWKLAEHFDLGATLVDSVGDDNTYYGADWMLLSRNRAFFRQPEIASAGTPRKGEIRIGLWTDDYHNLFQILK